MWVLIPWMATSRTLNPRISTPSPPAVRCMISNPHIAPSLLAKTRVREHSPLRRQRWTTREESTNYHSDMAILLFWYVIRSLVREIDWSGKSCMLWAASRFFALNLDCNNLNQANADNIFPDLNMTSAPMIDAIRTFSSFLSVPDDLQSRLHTTRVTLCSPRFLVCRTTFATYSQTCGQNFVSRDMFLVVLNPSSPFQPVLIAGFQCKCAPGLSRPWRNSFSLAGQLTFWFATRFLGFILDLILYLSCKFPAKCSLLSLDIIKH